MSSLAERTPLPLNRKATFSLKRALAPLTLLVLSIKNTIIKIFEALIEARRLQSAYETATQLRTHNKDFKNMSHQQIVHWILDKDNS